MRAFLATAPGRIGAFAALLVAVFALAALAGSLFVPESVVAGWSERAGTTMPHDGGHPAPAAPAEGGAR